MKERKLRVYVKRSLFWTCVLNAVARLSKQNTAFQFAENETERILLGKV